MPSFCFFSDPLVSNRDGKHLLLGIASFGLSCEDIEIQGMLDYSDYEGPSSRSGVYTNVASYVDWIKANSDYNECRMSKSNYLVFSGKYKVQWKLLNMNRFTLCSHSDDVIYFSKNFDATLAFLQSAIKTEHSVKFHFQFM